ncbi:MAG: trypsin-like peptidase domain-containing protein [Polyangiales bacterium]
MKPITPIRLTFAASACALSLVGAPMAHSQVPPSPVVAAQVTAPTQPPNAVVGEMQRLSDGFAEVAANVLPAVVSIRVEATRAEPEGPMGFGFPFPFGGGRESAPDIVRGTGSGVVVRADGVIVTNNHVVRDADRIEVHLRDGRVLRAQVLGTDPSTDLAVIKVEAQGLPTARWGDSEAARVGEWVLAIGAPFGLEATVTHGVLSAKGRANLGANAIEDYLQTDASINPGNSGGPLVNLRGEVLGINTMIIGRGSGVGFAVPSRLARLVAEQVTAQGQVTRGWVGVGVQDLNAALAEAFHLQPDSGALVSQVDSAGPAARTGLTPGDVIVRIDGHAVHHSSDVVREVTAHRPGDRVELDVVRNGQSRHITLSAARRPDERAEGPRGNAPTLDARSRSPTRSVSKPRRSTRRARGCSASDAPSSSPR